MFNKRFFLVLAFSVLAITSSGLSQETLTLFTDVNESLLDNSQISYLKAIKNRRATAVYKVVGIPFDKNVGNAAKIVMHMKPGLTLQAKQESIERRDEDYFMWLGKIEGKFSQVTLAVNSGGIYGTI